VSEGGLDSQAIFPFSEFTKPKTHHSESPPARARQRSRNRLRFGGIDLSRRSARALISPQHPAAQFASAANSESPSGSQYASLDRRCENSSSENADAGMRQVSQGHHP